jgi:hypothetical protein
MARPPKPEAEPYPDSWVRFERAVDAAIKNGPKHKTAEKKKPTRKVRDSSSDEKP